MAEARNVGKAPAKILQTGDLLLWILSSNVKSPARVGEHRIKKVLDMNGIHRKQEKQDARAACHVEEIYDPHN